MIWWPFDPEYVVSDETWNGGEGTISFNHLQQREADTSVNDNGLYPTTTDIWGVTDLA